MALATLDTGKGEVAYSMVPSGKNLCVCVYARACACVCMLACVCVYMWCVRVNMCSCVCVLIYNSISVRGLHKQLEQNWPE